LPIFNGISSSVSESLSSKSNSLSDSDESLLGLFRIAAVCDRVVERGAADAPSACWDFSGVPCDRLVGRAAGVAGAPPAWVDFRERFSAARLALADELNSVSL